MREDPCINQAAPDEPVILKKSVRARNTSTTIGLKVTVGRPLQWQYYEQNLLFLQTKVKLCDLLGARPSIEEIKKTLTEKIKGRYQIIIDHAGAPIGIGAGV